MIVIEFEIVHSQYHTHYVTNGFGFETGAGQMARGVEGFSASFDSFLVRYVSVKRRNVKCYQEGSR